MRIFVVCKTVLALMKWKNVIGFYSVNLFAVTWRSNVINLADILFMSADNNIFCLRYLRYINHLLTLLTYKWGCKFFGGQKLKNSRSFCGKKCQICGEFVVAMIAVQKSQICLSGVKPKHHFCFQ